MLVRHLPADSATRHALEGDGAHWGLSEQLLAAAVDALAAGNWQRQGGKGARPKPIPRPGVRGPTVRRHYGRTDRPPRDVARYLDHFKPPPRPYPETFGPPPPD